MPSTYPAELRRRGLDLARSGTSVAQLSETFGMSEATIYNWTKLEKIDPRGGLPARAGHLRHRRADAAHPGGRGSQAPQGPNHRRNE
jgi:transposase